MIAAAACLLSPAAAAEQGEPGSYLEAPRALDIARAADIRDAVVSPAVSRRLSARLPASWGGAFRTAQAQTVTVRISSAYPQDPAVAQRWADFLGTLVHGPELSSLTVYLAPPREVRSLCGGGALACYSPQRSLAVVPGEDPRPETSAEAVLTHEYGHHVGANRVNPPWSAIDWGTKRWASYQQVCARARAGELFPRTQDPVRYVLDPAEGFAESYRLLNERRAGRAETPWTIVSRRLYPDDTALALLQQDVVSPWTSNTVDVARGSFTRAGAAQRVYTTSAAYDGTIEATLTISGAARLSLALVDAAGRVVSRSRATATSRVARVRTTVCGSRSFRLRVTRASGAATFSLTISKP